MSHKKYITKENCKMFVFVWKQQRQLPWQYDPFSDCVCHNETWCFLCIPEQKNREALQLSCHSAQLFHTRKLCAILSGYFCKVNAESRSLNFEGTVILLINNLRKQPLMWCNVSQTFQLYTSLAAFTSNHNWWLHIDVECTCISPWCTLV